MSDNKYLRYPAVLRKFIPLFEKWKGWLNQGVNTTDSPNFAGLTVGGNTVWHAGNAGRLLWSGTWSSGNITIADVAKYTFFNIMTNDTSAPFIGVKSANGQILAGFMVTGDTGVITTRAVWITISGTTLTLAGARGMSHNAGSSHGSLWQGYGITSIYGLV